MTQHIVVDGRVFATAAADRGMGRYVEQLLVAFGAAGHRVTVLLPVPNVGRQAWPARVRAHTLMIERDPMLGTARLNRFLSECGATFYVDATPFLPPDRYDVHVCPVVAVLYDVIPLRFPGNYFPSLDSGEFDEYVNGLARVQKADHVVAISNYVTGHALRYLGIPKGRCTVIPPDVGPEYRAFAAHPPAGSNVAGGIVSIQGAHRSKNFPAAIRFLEQLSRASETGVDIVVPTLAQRKLVDDELQDNDRGVRVWNSISEQHKFSLQASARAIAHLSLDEGYGIPLAEALYLYRPVICIDNAINRELIGGDDPGAAGILLLTDPALGSSADLRAAAKFVCEGPPAGFAATRRRVVDRLVAQQAQVEAALERALVKAKADFDAWHSRAGLALAAPTELGSCGVSDYCHALMRSHSSRYVLLLARAPRELQLKRQIRLLPVSLLEDVRHRTRGVMFNLAISHSLSRAFGAIVEHSAPDDVLIVHDAGSYLPGLLALALESGDRKAVFERFLRGEPDDVRALSFRWLNASNLSAEQTAALFLRLDRSFRSLWLRAFRGKVVSHHAAFERGNAGKEEGVLALLPTESELLKRTRYTPMPIDARANPGLARLAGKMRWALGLAREDMLVCCAGSVVRGKHLDEVARVIARLDEQIAGQGRTSAITLMLAGRVLDNAVFAALIGEFASRGLRRRLVHIVEMNETRYDALLMASDVVIAFREQRYIQMSHSYVRALALGCPIITNEGAGFDDQEAAAVCRDDHLDEDLERYLLKLWDVESARRALAALSLSRFRARHMVDAFFARVATLSDAPSASRVATLSDAPPAL